MLIYYMELDFSLSLNAQIMNIFLSSAFVNYVIKIIT